MKTTKLLTILLISLLFINCADTNKEAPATTTDAEPADIALNDEPVKESILFDRLGGEEGISSLVDDIVEAHLNNPKIKDKFTPLLENPEHFNMFKQNVKDFFGSGSGGDVTYKGRDMPTAHKGLQINGIEFVEGTSDIMKVMEQHNIDEESRKDVLYILFSFRDQVIGQ